MEPIELNLQSDNTLFLFLSVSFLILGILYAFHYKYTKLLILSSIGKSYAKKYLRDENVFKRRVNILFSALMILNISIFIWTLGEQLSNSLSSFLFIVLFVMLYYSVKYLLLKFLGFLLKIKQIADVAVFFTNLYDKIFALFCLPCLLFFHFFLIDLDIYFSYLMFGIFISFFILKIFWIFRIGIKSFGLSSFYLFLYICMLEFFPLLFVVNKGIFVLI